jgi:BirA family biotin operon repressor/biotin-[acetyl-CoA-carboxylase] ligase
LPLPFAGNPIGKPFIELQSIDSTNKYAMALVHGDLLPDGHGEIQHGMAIFTHEQTAGKGQRGKNWLSEKDANIALSILLNPYPLSIPDQFKLSVCIGVSGLEFFSKYAGEETKIKWPNDLYWRDRKAGGILIENVIQGSQSAVGSRWSSGWQWAIAGIGININQSVFDPRLPNPVSLKQITGKNFQPVDLAKELCSIIENNYQLLIKGGF